MKVTVQRVFRGRAPSNMLLVRWARRAIHPYRPRAVMTIRIIGAKESAALNHAWRRKVGPTNVLAFQVDGLDEVMPDLLGDVVICAPVAALEARVQNKTLDAHWAHLVIHGTLHLLGFDHVKPERANVMEAIERRILAELDYPDPYLQHAYA